MIIFVINVRVNQSIVCSLLLGVSFSIDSRCLAVQFVYFPLIFAIKLQKKKTNLFNFKWQKKRKIAHFRQARKNIVFFAIQAIYFNNQPSAAVTSHKIASLSVQTLTFCQIISILLSE